MKIKDIMITNPITVSPDDTLEHARSVLELQRIRHLPVVENEKLVGIVSDRDLRDALPSVLLDLDNVINVLQSSIATIMKKEIITIHPSEFVEEAASIIHENKIGCLPVIQKDKLVGIVTETDLLHTLIELMGAHQPSSVLKVEVPDRLGVLADVTQRIKECNVAITNVYSYPSKKSGKKNISLRLGTMDLRRVTTILQNNGYDIVWPKIECGDV